MARFDENGIKSVLLKGGASVVSGLYDDPAERILTDIDVLIAPAQIEAAEKALRANGYTNEIVPEPPRRWFRTASRSPSPPPSVDPANKRLHHRTSHFVGRREAVRVDVTRRGNQGTRDRRSMEWKGHRISASHRLSDAQHCAFATSPRLVFSRMIELRQLRELALLVARYRDELDWGEIERRFSAAGYGQVLAEAAVYCESLWASPSLSAKPTRKKR